jgi:hypothetical protein
MTGEKRGYAIALAVAVAFLVGSMLMVGSGMIDNRNRFAIGSSYDQPNGSSWGPGMMDNGSGDGAVSQAQAQDIAQKWVTSNAAGATLNQIGAMPMGFIFTVTRNNQVVATLIVNDNTGALSVRQWIAPVPSPSGSS